MNYESRPKYPLALYFPSQLRVKTLSALYMVLLNYYLYDTPIPSRGKSTPVQKGLIPSHNGGGADISEEGLGFGVPILQYVRDFYFPGTSSVHPLGLITDSLASKEFKFDLIERSQIKRSRVEHFSWVESRLSLNLFKNTLGRQVLKFLSQHVFNRGIKPVPPPAFIHTKDRGTANTIYEFGSSRKKIHVKIEFKSLVQTQLQRIFISNELGGSLFTFYRDGANFCLFGNAIGPYEKINAQWALFYAPSLKWGFRVDFPDGVTGLLGREINPVLCWSGVILSIPPSRNLVEYDITIGSLKEIAI